MTQAGGAAHLYSELGLGTTFTALFPATNAAVDPAAPQVSQRAEYGHGTVLVVEDEDAIREVARRILAASGYHVRTASTGTEALAVLDMHHTELARQVRAVCPGVHVLFMSGYAQPVIASKGHLDPGMALIEKPFTAPTLLTTVRDVLDS